MYSLIAAMGNTLASDGAQTTAGAAGGAGSSIIMLVLMLAVFYFLLIRPQKKRDKETKDMLSSLKKGDKVVTIGGIHGTIASLKDNSVVLKVDDDTRIEFNRTAIATVVERKAGDEEKKDEAAKDVKDDSKESKPQSKMFKKKTAVEVVEKPVADAAKTDEVKTEEVKETK